MECVQRSRKRARWCGIGETFEARHRIARLRDAKYEWLEAARLISASIPECGLILFTMFASDQLCILAQAAGVRAVVSKDCGGMHDLVEAIEKITSEAA